MRNLIRWIPVFVVMAALMTGAGCSTVVYDEGAGYTDSDSSIERDIISRLRNDDVTGKYLFGVEANLGTVTLRGTVPDGMVRARAIGIAYSAAGVRDVIDQIRSW
ncbi:MAG: BON domain-containing protein [Kiritimatiellia bacterium]